MGVTITTPSTPLKVSYSQLSTWDRCRYAWHLSYQEGWHRKQQSTALSIGTIGHDLLATWYKSFDRQVVQDRKVEILDTSDLNDVSAIRRVFALVDRYLEEDEITEAEIIGVEQHFDFMLTTPQGRSYELQGYIDLLRKDWLDDHKFVGKFYTERELELDPQMSLYLLGVRQFGYNPVGFKHNMLYTYDYKNGLESVATNKLFKRIAGYRTDTELKAIEHEVGLIVDDIMDNRARIRRSLRRECTYCQFHEVCQYGMKGIDLAQYMPANFTKEKLNVGNG